MYSYIIVRTIPTILIPGTSLWTSTTRTTAVRVYNNSIYMTLCTERFTCCIFGITTAVTTAAVVVVVVVVVVVLRLTHRYNAVRGHGTGSTNSCSSSSVQHARSIIWLFLGETHARGSQIRHVTRTYAWFFLLERRVLVPQAVGRLAVLIQQ